QSPHVYPFRTREALMVCQHRQHYMLICRDVMAKPSDGLEPSTPPYHGGLEAVTACTDGHSRARLACKSAVTSVPAVPARDRTCSRWCTRLVPAVCCLFLKQTQRDTSPRLISEKAKTQIATKLTDSGFGS